MTLVWSPDYAPVDGDFDSVSLLLKGEGTNGSTNVLDSSSNNLSVTANGDAQIINTVATPFSPTVPSEGVLSFDGSGDYFTISTTSQFAFATGDFTVEIWFRPAALSGQQVLIDTRPTGDPSVTDKWIVFANGTSLSVVVAGSTFTNGTLLLNAWNFIALSRQTGTTRIFLNGVQLGGNITDATNYGIGNQRPIVGADGNNPTLLNVNGYLSNIRITKGVARYTENFDVPTAPFPILSPSGRITIADYSLDADARQYIINVEEQDGEELEAGVRTAINDFVVGCKSDGIWNAIKASCLLCGARTLEGALVPLKGSAPTNFNFTLSDYDRELGLVGDGSTKYLNSNRAGNADPQDNRHVSVFIKEITTLTTQAVFGTGGQFPSGGTQLYYGTGGAANRMLASSSAAGAGPAITTGLLGLSRTNNSSISSISSGSVSLLSNTSATPIATNITIFATIFTDQLTQFTDARLAFYSIGEALPDSPTQSGLELLDSRISAFITAIGAAIP